MADPQVYNIVYSFITLLYFILFSVAWTTTMEPMKISVLCVIFIEINCQLLDLTRCSLKSVTPEQQRDMLPCFTECCYNPCCKAVNIRTCEQSYIDTEEMDYVKQVR